MLEVCSSLYVRSCSVKKALILFSSFISLYQKSISSRDLSSLICTLLTA